MSAPPNPPRRIAPQAGAATWAGADLPASEYMLPLGAEHAAELGGSADAPTPRLDALAAELDARLDHGRGLALLRGLPAAAEPDALLRRLGRRLGTPLPEPEPGTAAALPDLLLLALATSAELALLSAAAVHNALLGADRTALAALYESSAPGRAPVFAVADGVFAGRADPVRLASTAASPALADVLARPELALRLSLRPGDVLALNPFLAWLRPERPDSLEMTARLGVRTARSRAASFAPAGNGA